MRITVGLIRSKLKGWPEEDIEKLIADNRKSEDEIELDDQTAAKLLTQVPVEVVPTAPRPEPLTLRFKIANFAKATATWALAGFPLVSHEELTRRGTICQGDEAQGIKPCEFWLSQRAIPQCAICGCGDMKHELATETCPKGKWGALKTT